MQEYSTSYILVELLSVKDKERSSQIFKQKTPQMLWWGISEFHIILSPTEKTGAEIECENIATSQDVICT